MNKKIKIIILVLLILVILYPFFLFPINQILNSFKQIGKQCTVDEDCKMSAIDCSPCYAYTSGEAVNKNYTALCPLPELYTLKCPLEEPSWKEFKAVCEKNKCTE